MTEKENSTMRSRSFRLDRRFDRRPDQHAAPETPQNRLSSQRVTRQSFQKYDKRRRKRGSSFAQGIGLAAMLLLLGDVLVVGESTEEERESPFSEKLLSSSKNNLIPSSNNSRPEVDRVFAVLHSEVNDRNGSTTRVNSVVELNETSSSTPLIVTTTINASENSVFDGKLFATESSEILENSIQQSKPSRRILTSDAVRTSTVTTTSERNMKSVKSESAESSEGKMIEVTAKIDANTEESGESTMPTSGTTALEYEFVGLTDLPTTTLVVSTTVSSDTVSASVEKSTTDMTTTTVSTTTSQESTDSFSTISETTIATTQETGNLNFSVTDAPSGFTEAIQTTSESSDSTTTDLAESITESITEISMESGRSITGNIVRSVGNTENTESITESTTESSTESAESTEIIIENVTVIGNGENVTEKTTQSTETTEDIVKTTISIDNNVDSSTESKNNVNNTEKTTQSTETTESIINTTISTNNTIDNSNKNNISNSVIETTVDSMTNEVTDEIIHKIVENTTNEITTINMIDATTVVIVDNHSTTRPPGRKSHDAEDVTSLVKIELEGTWKEVCPCMKKMKNMLAEILSKGTDKEVSSTQIKIHGNFCSEDGTVSSAAASIDGSPTSLLIYIVDENGKFDSDMTRILPTLLKEPSVSGKFPLTIHGIFLVPSFLQENSGNAIAVVIVSSVAFICLLLLAALLFIMRKRQARFNYGERCRPVSLDAYSLDSVSAYNSVRRKGATRSSKRSYGNPTFEDSSAVPSHPLNFAGLSSFCNDLNAINEEFLNIPQVTAKIDELPPGAEVKNRYANVIPLPESRVTLQRVGNDPLSEYINANYVRGPKNVSKYYIACQAPMESTVTDFWRMIWEQRCKIIIMLTDLVENGVEKCTEYVPPSEVTDCHRLYGDFQVTLKKRETKEKYAISTLHLKNLENNTFREVFHIWYLWPENSVQTDGAGLIAVLLEARALQRGGPGPVVVHCSPGTGRTGTLIALDLAIRQYEVTRTVDVPRVVYTIRRDRAGAVQTKEQYAFIYKVLNLYATKLAGGMFEST